MPDPTLDVAKFKAMIDQMKQMSTSLHPETPTPAPAGPDPDAFHAQLQQEDSVQPSVHEASPTDPDTVHAQLSKDESGGGFWNWLQKPIVDQIPGAKSYLEKRAQPGLAESKPGSEWYQNPEAMLHGFSTGALEAMTPGWAAGAATLGTGAPAVAGNAVLAAQGAHEMADPNASWGQKAGGAANLVGGGFGALHGLLKTGGQLGKIAGAFERTPAPAKSAEDIAREVVAARTADFTTPQKRDALRIQDAYEKALSGKRAATRTEMGNLQDQFGTAIGKRGLVDEAAAAEAQQQAEALAEAQRIKSGMEEQQPTVSQTVKAKKGPGTITATRKWAVPQEDVPTPTPPAAPVAPVDPRARLGELIDKDKVGTLTGPELDEARVLDKQLRASNFESPGEPTTPPTGPRLVDPEADAAAARYQESLANPPAPSTPESVASAQAAAADELATNTAANEAAAQAKAQADIDAEAADARKNFGAVRGGKFGEPTAAPSTEPAANEPPITVAQGPNISGIDEPLSTDPYSHDYPAFVRNPVTGEHEPFIPPTEPPASVGPSASAMEELRNALGKPKEPSLASDYGQQMDVNDARGGFQPRYAPKPGATPVEPTVAPPAAAAAPTTAADVPVNPEGPEYQPSTEPSITKGEMSAADIDAENALIERAHKDPSFMDLLKRAAQEEKGAVNPGLLKLMGGVTGGAIGAPIGASQEPDDPLLGGLKGGAIGALLGAGTMPTGDESLFRNLMQYRNASLLAGPAQAKKVLGDLGGVSFEGLKRLITPGQTQTGANVFKELGRLPTNAKNYWRGLGPNPDIGTSIGDVVRASTNSPLGWVTRPFNAAMYASQEVLKRAGITNPETIQKILGVNTPETEAGRWWYGGQKYPAVQYLRPFAKIATNMAEGVRNVPGIGQFAGNPEDRLQRQIIGGLQMGLGGLSEEYDQAQEEQGNPRSLTSEALRAAAMGPQGVAPYALGKGITAIASGGPAKALQELIRLVPGSQAVLPTQYPNESADAYAKRVLTNPITQMAPSVLLPDPGTVR